MVVGPGWDYPVQSWVVLVAQEVGPPNPQVFKHDFGCWGLRIWRFRVVGLGFRFQGLALALWVVFWV